MSYVLCRSVVAAAFSSWGIFPAAANRGDSGVAAALVVEHLEFKHSLRKVQNAGLI